jgi:cytosine/adenosine deaminase-related metal-dependent hydrolase
MARLCGAEAREDLRTMMAFSSYQHLKQGTTLVGEYPPAVDGEGLDVIAETVRRTDIRGAFALQNWSQVEFARTAVRDSRTFFLALGGEEDLTVYNIGTMVRTSRESLFPLCVHLCERRDGAETLRKNFQKSVGFILRDLGVLKPDTVLVHMNHATEQDLDVLEEAGCSLVLCPASTARKQTGYPLLRHLQYRGIRLAIGSDWGGTDMLAELRFLSNLPTLSPAVPSFSPIELLRMATVNGAHALGLGDQCGSIEVGKRADFVLFNISNVRLPALPPLPHVRDLSSLLVTNLDAADISDVMINGHFCVNAGQVVTATEEDLLSEFNRLLREWYQEATQAGMRPAGRDESARPAKIVPLLPRDYGVIADEENFEEGFTVLGSDQESDFSVPPPIARFGGPERTQEVREEQKPELPGDVQRVFGEDDDE